MALHTIRSTNRIKIVVVTGEPVHCRRAEAGAWSVRRKEPGFPVKMMDRASWTRSLWPDHMAMMTPMDHRLAGYSVRGGRLRQPSFRTACAHGQ